MPTQLCLLFHFMHLPEHPASRGSAQSSSHTLFAPSLYSDVEYSDLAILLGYIPHVSTIRISHRAWCLLTIHEQNIEWIELLLVADMVGGIVNKYQFPNVVGMITGSTGMYCTFFGFVRFKFNIDLALKPSLCSSLISTFREEFGFPHFLQCYLAPLPPVPLPLSAPVLPVPPPLSTSHLYLHP